MYEVAARHIILLAYIILPGMSMAVNLAKIMREAPKLGAIYVYFAERSCKHHRQPHAYITVCPIFRQLKKAKSLECHRHSIGGNTAITRSWWRFRHGIKNAY